MTRIVIFASGAGSNARQIIRHFDKHPSISISAIACNKPGAGVIDIARAAGIPVILIEKERFFRGDAYLPELLSAQTNLIVLAGFLWKLPEKLIQAFPDRILNIHPALLPAHGGKGMYGMHVHEAVIRNADPQSGITIHVVDEQYDHGKTIFQARVDLEPGETPETLADKIHKLEHEHYPKIIEAYLHDVKAC